MSFDKCRRTVLYSHSFKHDKPVASGSLLKMLVTHTDVLTKSDRQLVEQRNAYLAAGIGPWSKKTRETFTASYCGRKVKIKRWGYLTTNTDETYVAPGVSYFEILRDVSKQPNFFKDYASTHAQGFSYQGMIPANKGLSTDQVISALRARKVPVIMRWENRSPDGPYANLIIKLGKIYAEVIIVPGVI